MKEENKIKYLLEELSEITIAYRPSYSLICKNPMAGLLLSQLMYWGIKVMKGNEFYISDKQLCAELGFSTSNLATARKYIKEAKLINITRKGIPAQLHYIINSENIINAITSYWKSNNKKLEFKELVIENQITSSLNSDNYIHKNTHKNTHKNKTKYTTPTKVGDVDKPENSFLNMSSLNKESEKVKKVKTLTKAEQEVYDAYKKFVNVACKETTATIVTGIPRAIRTFNTYFSEPDEALGNLISAIETYTQTPWFKQTYNEKRVIFAPKIFFSQKFIDNNLVPLINLNQKNHGSDSEDRYTDEELREAKEANKAELRKWRERRAKRKN